ncbi:MAG: hypothetical protein BWK78_04485 [Thiotrichaceae bacterium IS1]|nr:MAG: hypothetical protein BWK78_04485 [Thiotrichaceae bacterium IS1]
MRRFTCLVFLSWILASYATVCRGGDGHHEIRELGEGERYFQQGHFELAADSWERLLSEAGNNPPNNLDLDISVRLATTYQLLGRLQRAYEVLEKVKPVAKSFVTTKPSESALCAEQFSDLALCADMFIQLGNVHFALRDSRLIKYDKDHDTWLNQLDIKPFTRERLIEKARYYLDQAEEVIGNCSDNKKYPLLCANIMNDKGNILVENGKNYAKYSKYSLAKEEYEKTVKAYREAGKYAEQAKNAVLGVNVSTNIIQTRLQQQVSLEKDYIEVLQQSIGKSGINNEVAKQRINETLKGIQEILGEVEIELIELEKKLQSLPDNYDKAFALISVATFAQKLSALASIKKQKQQCLKDDRELAEENDQVRLSALQQASKIAELSNKRILAYAEGAMAQLYADKGCYKEAIQLTQQAIFHARNYPAMLDVQHYPAGFFLELWNYPELLHDLEKQQGEFLEAEGEYLKAIEAYKKSISHFEEVQERYGNYPDSLLQSAREVSINLLDLLLKQPRRDQLDNLKEVEKVANSFNSLSIQEFFKDSCVTRKFESKEDKQPALPDDTAALFIIAHHDEVDLLLRVGEKLSVKTVRGCDKENEQGKIGTFTCLKEEVDKFRNNIYKYRIEGGIPVSPYDPNYGKPLYKLLIKPMAGELEGQGIKNLMVVSIDFPIIPFVALYDGDRYLVERYAVVTSYHSSTSKSFDPEFVRLDDKLLLGALPSTADPVLLNVSKEIKIVSLFATKEELMEEKFTGDALETSVKDNKRFDNFHFSTHGVSKPTGIYIQAYNKEELTIDRLEEILQQQTDPPKLLTFSACQSAIQSAIGDKDNWLGLSGMAVKTGGYNAVGTLWLVNSISTADLMVEFYKQLVCKKHSIATALQYAQLCLMKGDSEHCLSNSNDAAKNEDGIGSTPLSCEKNNSPNKKLEKSQWDDPYYWAPFLIIGR